uniref:Uncharacterized protein TCIL3000_11_12930 n=1 Tax=Trypanosoma congolense (strain IL3000) TaxID=1068625 RepID=G0V2C3_TRYCI|nr:unnamed protein product [Trypanosoma congolense IL3000]
MTFVFEARRLPFGHATPSYADAASDRESCVTEADLEELPAWKRRLVPAVMEVVRQHFENSDGDDDVGTVSCWKAVLNIVGELHELEAAYARIVEYQDRQRRGEKTAEELFLEELLRERIGDAFPRDNGCAEEEDTSSISGDDNNHGDEVDIAMCFNADGTVVGIGSAGLFGGHGYHRQPPRRR